MSVYTAKGGDTFFIEQTAAQLGVAKSLIEVISVKEGSVIVNFKVKSTSSTTQTKLNTAVTNGDMDFYDAEILNYESGFVVASKNSPLIHFS